VSTSFDTGYSSQLLGGTQTSAAAAAADIVRRAVVRRGKEYGACTLPLLSPTLARPNPTLRFSSKKNARRQVSLGSATVSTCSRLRISLTVLYVDEPAYELVE
jgi:hypothetical protein